MGLVDIVGVTAAGDRKRVLVEDDGAIAVGGSLTSSTLYDGTLAATTSAAALAASTPVEEVVVVNDPDNSVDILVGNSSSQSNKLGPGDSATVVIDDLNKIYIKTASGTATVTYLARG